MLQTTEQVIESYGIKVNKIKTKLIVCCGKEQKIIRINLTDQLFEEISEFSHFDGKIIIDERCARKRRYRMTSTDMSTEDTFTTDCTAIEIKKI